MKERERKRGEERHFTIGMWWAFPERLSLKEGKLHTLVGCAAGKSHGVAAAAAAVVAVAAAARGCWCCLVFKGPKELAGIAICSSHFFFRTAFCMQKLSTLLLDRLLLTGGCVLY